MAQITGLTENWNNHTYREVEAYWKENIVDMQGVVGTDVLKPFTPTSGYTVGKYVKYNNNVYRFITPHTPNTPWNIEEVVKTSVFGELQDVISTDSEAVEITLSSSDGELVVSGINVSITYEDGTPTETLITDVNGQCSISIPKNKIYTVAVPNQEGYQHCPISKNRASINQRFIYFVYEKIQVGNVSTVNVTLVPSGARPEAIVQFSGVTVNLVLSDGTARSTTTNANGVATFQNVTRGVSGFTANPKIIGFITPAANNFVIDSETVSLFVTYSAMTAPGIFMVRDDGAEFEYALWDTSDTCVALHITTQALVDSGCDYYVPIDELTASWFTNEHGIMWATERDVLFPNVLLWSAGTPYYDGASATTLMISDAALVSVQSPLAEFAVEQRFTLKGKTAQGFIGTRDQWQPILDNEQMIYQMYTLIGKTSAWYNRTIWTSSQAERAYAWFYDGKYGWGNFYGDGGIKRSRHAAVPFFSI